jgi:hypothetical protein
VCDHAYCEDHLPSDHDMLGTCDLYQVRLSSSRSGRSADALTRMLDCTLHLDSLALSSVQRGGPAVP